MKVINLLKTSLELFKNKITHSIYQKKSNFDNELSDIMLEVKKNGICVIPDFMDKEICQDIIKEIDKLFIKHKEYIWSDELKSDKRAFGINNVSELINYKYYMNPLIIETRKAYYKLEDNDIIGCTMANKIIPTDNNLGSGQGWHRDSVNTKQFKAILYLTDVTKKRGAFQYIKGSQKKKSVLEGIVRHDFNHNHNRFSNSEIEKFTNNKKYDISTFTGKAGTLLLVDTSGIHRGMPIEEKNRYALTNYYWISPEKGGKPHYEKLDKYMIK